jgi:hypothetical protein
MVLLPVFADDDYVTKPFGLEEQHVIGSPAPLRATRAPAGAVGDRRSICRGA